MAYAETRYETAMVMQPVEATVGRTTLTLDDAERDALVQLTQLGCDWYACGEFGKLVHVINTALTRTRPYVNNRFYHKSKADAAQATCATCEHDSQFGFAQEACPGETCTCCCPDCGGAKEGHNG